MCITQKTKILSAILVFLALAMVLFPVAPVHAQETAEVSLEPAEIQGEVGDVVAVEVWCRGLVDVYGFEVHLAFDPERIAIIDGDNAEDGNQVTPGSFMDPGAGFLVLNEADNSAGTIDYAFTLLAPAEPVNENGVLIRFEVELLKSGTGDIAFTGVILADNEGLEVPSVTTDASVEVFGDELEEPIENVVVEEEPTSTVISTLQAQEDSPSSPASEKPGAWPYVIGFSLLVVVALILYYLIQRKTE